MAFGAAPSPFGAPAASLGFSGFGTSPFGAASQPAASTGFSFSTPSAAPAFGAASSAPAFGAASSAPAFGAASSAPAFGASSTPSLFGATSSPAFGTPTSSPAFSFSAASSAAASGFSFASAAGAASAPAFGSSLFAPAATSTGTGLFGQPAASQPAAGAGIFGAITTQQPQQAQQQLPPLGYGSGLEYETAKRELEAIAGSYMPGHTSFKFQHLFLNVVDNPAQRIKPPQVVDELCWKQALRDAGGPDNADRLWPVPGSGFEDLLRRGQAQAQALAENRARLDQLRDVAHKLGQRQATEVASRVAAARDRHVELSNRLLAAARHVDGLEGRLASFQGVRGELSRGREAALSRALEGIEAQLSPTSPAGLQRRLDALAAACKLRAHAGAGLGAGPEAATARLDEASLQQLFSVLQEHVEGLRQLQAVLRRDLLDLDIMRGVRQDAGGGGVSAAAHLAVVEYA